MAHRVFFLNKLREGVSAEDYEQWVRDVDYPFARGIPSIKSYIVTRLDASLEGDERPPYDFAEVVEVTGIEAYKADLSTDKPEIQAFDEQWFKYVGETVAVYGEVVD